MYVEDDFTLALIKNITNTAEGSTLPTKVKGGDFRVPPVTALKINRAILFAGGDHIQYFLTWLNSDIKNVDHYNIYVSNTTNPKGTVTSPFSVKNSPAIVLAVVPPDPTSRNIITIQTVLSSGLMSSISNSPSVVGGLVNFP